MKVFVTQDFARSCLTIYVELQRRSDGVRAYLTRDLTTGEDLVVTVDPCMEAPHFTRIGFQLAPFVAQALLRAPFIEKVVEIETWRQFVALLADVGATDQQSG